MSQSERIGPKKLEESIINDQNNVQIIQINTISTKKGYQCEKCSQGFTRKSNFTRHSRKMNCSIVRCKLFKCQWCIASYSHKSNLMRHKTNKHSINICLKCGTWYLLSAVHTCKVVKTKIKQKKNIASQSKNFRFHCHNCSFACVNKQEFYYHYMRKHQVGRGVLQEVPWQGRENTPWIENNGKVNEKLKLVYDLHASLILQPHILKPLISLYNFPIDNNLNMDILLEQIHYVYENQARAFKVNIAFGYIMQNIETKEYRYFKIYENQNILPRPFLIHKNKDIQKLKNYLKQIDIVNLLLVQRENTKWKLFLLTNVMYSVSSLDFVLGQTCNLPDYIKSKKNIIPFDKNYKGVLYEDNLCFFRCLSANYHPLLLQRRQYKLFNEKVKTYFSKWLKFKKMKPDKFEGVNIIDLPDLEQCFKINILIFKLHEDDSCSNIYKTLGAFSNTLHLNQFENHLSFIKNVNKFCSKYACSHCQKLFKRKDHCNNHEKKCSTKIKLKFPGGFYQPKATIFEKLELYGVKIEQDKKLYKDFIVFDFESILKPMSQKTRTFTWTHVHIPISVSICSNFKNFTEPHCIINTDEEQLITEMYAYMLLVAKAIQLNKRESFEDEFSKINELLSECEYLLEGETRTSILKGYKIILKQLTKLKKEFEEYCDEVPVLGFNSSRYDINLIKAKFLKTIGVADAENRKFIIKKGNNYLCISNGILKFLDITNYLSPGSSYVQFLKAFDITEEKGFFPYEYFTDEAILLTTSLPPLGKAWWSTLKNKCVLSDGHRSVQENYKKLQDIWQKENMQTFADFLKWYNNLDVLPFVKATEKLSEFYFQEKIDIFKECISVPGIARKMLFEEAQKKKAYFSLIRKQDEDLFHCIDANLVGGPSIIFQRFQKRNQTFIRNNPKYVCKKIIGFDANSLYLYNMGQTMPVGSYIRRKLTNGFKPEKPKYEKMFYWMDWLNLHSATNIKHFKNMGKEKRIGPYLVDGYDSDTQTVYQYQGCFFHSHNCKLTKYFQKKNKELYIARQERTKHINCYIKEHGYPLVEIYECEFDKMVKESLELQTFINQQLSAFTRKHPGKVTGKQILQGVLEGTLFGMVEIDISVPNCWSEVPYHPETTLNPASYFHEMSPLFGTALIPFEKIGETMQEHIINNNLSTKPRELLVGVMKAEQILIATPLLKWYIEHGLKVTKIYQVVEYNNPFACFDIFVKKVTDARRKGDENAKGGIIAQTMKLIGNSAFGGTIVNQMNHRKFTYVDSYEAGSKAINNKNFAKITEISEEFYEIEQYKKLTNLNMPTQIGFFILQLAKLRMLEFYYDFCDRFIDRCDFQYVEMDTDSAYISITSEKIEDIIKPSFKELYNFNLKGFCTNDPYNADNIHHWFPRTCCPKHNKHDNRTPGLFKIEFEGEEIIGLSSKTYLVRQGDKVKFSSKGVNKQHVENPLHTFRTVLNSQKSACGKNYGFRLDHNQICTYAQVKQAFPYLYCKRKLSQDGISSSPLDIILQPSKRKRNCIQDFSFA